MAGNLADAQQQDVREQAAAHTLAANPLVGVRGEDLVASARLLLGEMLNNPAVSMRQYVALLAELGRIATGSSALAPDPKDRRFADPAWKTNAAYRVLAQSYLAWGNALYGFLDEAKIGSRDAERARFLVSLLVDALWSQPDWYRQRTMDDDPAAFTAQVISLRRALDLLGSRRNDRYEVALAARRASQG